MASKDLMLFPYKPLAEHLLSSLMQNLILSKLFVIPALGGLFTWWTTEQKLN